MDNSHTNDTLQNEDLKLAPEIPVESNEQKASLDLNPNLPINKQVDDFIKSRESLNTDHTISQIVQLDRIKPESRINTNNLLPPSPEETLDIDFGFITPRPIHSLPPSCMSEFDMYLRNDFDWGGGATWRDAWLLKTELDLDRMGLNEGQIDDFISQGGSARDLKTDFHTSNK